MRSKEYVFLGMHTQLLGSTAQDIIYNENNSNSYEVSSE